MKEENIPSISDEVVAMIEQRSYSQSSAATVRIEQSFSASEIAAAGIESRFQKEQLQKKQRTYSQAVRQIVLCRKYIDPTHDYAD